MAEPVLIQSPDDPRVAEYVGLKGRDPAGRVYFIAESELVVQRLAGSSFEVRSYLLSPDRHARLADTIATSGAPVYLADRDVMAAIAGYDVHRGVLASVTRRPSPLLADVLAGARRLLVLEGSNDTENIGAVARSARGLGIDALVLDPTCADPYSRRAVRVSMGEVLFLPVVRCTDWSASLAQIMAADFEVWALTPDPSAADLRTLPVPPKVAILGGAEGPGLTPATLAAATRQVRIPMNHSVDSLNLGHALAIAMAHVAP